MRKKTFPRWAVFRPGKDNVCADALSRLSIEEEATEERKAEKVLMLDILGDAPVDTPLDVGPLVM